MLKEKLYLDALRLYAGQHVVDRIQSQGRRALEYKYEAQVVTMMFVDFVGIDPEGFSGFDPAVLRTWLRAHHDLIDGCIEEHQGVVDNILGDAVLACWGMSPQVDHAALALRCAAKLCADIAAVSEQDQANGLPGKRLMIGINSGTVALGNHGTLRRARYTVMGDNVNLASRLVYRCKEYEVSTLLTDATLAMAGEAVPTHEVDTVRIKGKKNPVRLYTLDSDYPARSANSPPADE